LRQRISAYHNDRNQNQEKNGEPDIHEEAPSKVGPDAGVPS
jgi:hypothetical protein